MSSAFVNYLFVTGIAFGLAALIIGRPMRSSTGLVVWMWGALLVTYVLRPAGTEYSGDDFLYRWLNVRPLTEGWIGMATAVSLAVVSLAVGHRFGRRRFEGKADRVPMRASSARVARNVGLGLIAWGYVSITIAQAIGGQLVNDAGTQFGVFEGTSFWLTGSVLFVSSGATVLYGATRRLLLSLTLAVPWLWLALKDGHSRINIIGFFMGLLAVGLLNQSETRSRRRASTAPRLQLVALGVTLAFCVLVIFPALGTRRNFFATHGSLGQAISISIRETDWLKTTSDIHGYETTLYHLQHSRKPAWGTYYLYFYLLKPIPRVFWPNKPYPTSLAHDWLGIEDDPRYFGFAPGAVGMAFQQWGWVGIPGEFFVTGWVLASAEGLIRRRRDSLPHLIGYAGLFSLLPQVARDGFFYMLADRWLFVYGVPVLLLIAFSRPRLVKKGLTPTLEQAGAS